MLKNGKATCTNVPFGYVWNKKGGQRWEIDPEAAASVKKVFELVKEYLAEDGVFIFDLNTVHKYRDLMGECTISENREESSFIWENYFC